MLYSIKEIMEFVLRKSFLVIIIMALLVLVGCNKTKYTHDDFYNASAQSVSAPCSPLINTVSFGSQLITFYNVSSNASGYWTASALGQGGMTLEIDFYEEPTDGLYITSGFPILDNNEECHIQLTLL